MGVIQIVFILSFSIYVLLFICPPRLQMLPTPLQFIVKANRLTQRDLKVTFEFIGEKKVCQGSEEIEFQFFIKDIEFL